MLWFVLGLITGAELISGLYRRQEMRPSQMVVLKRQDRRGEYSVSGIGAGIDYVSLGFWSSKVIQCQFILAGLGRKELTN
jgi:hypothetical protein